MIVDASLAGVTQANSFLATLQYSTLNVINPDAVDAVLETEPARDKMGFSLCNSAPSTMILVHMYHIIHPWQFDFWLNSYSKLLL